jgi:hypothetical protein
LGSACSHPRCQQRLGGRRTVGAQPGRMVRDSAAASTPRCVGCLLCRAAFAALDVHHEHAPLPTAARRPQHPGGTPRREPADLRVGCRGSLVGERALLECVSPVNVALFVSPRHAPVRYSRPTARATSRAPHARSPFTASPRKMRASCRGTVGSAVAGPQRLASRRVVARTTPAPVRPVRRRALQLHGCACRPCNDGRSGWNATRASNSSSADPASALTQYLPPTVLKHAGEAGMHGDWAACMRRSRRLRRRTRRRRWW